MTLYQRIRGAFPDQPDEISKDFADKVLDNWKDVSRSLSRTVTLFFVLVAIFELLAYQHATGSFTIGSFSFAKTSVVKIFLPALIAYLIYDAYNLTINGIIWSSSTTSLLGQMHQK